MNKTELFPAKLVFSAVGLSVIVLANIAVAQKVIMEDESFVKVQDYPNNSQVDLARPYVVLAVK